LALNDPAQQLLRDLPRADVSIRPARQAALDKIIGA